MLPREDGERTLEPKSGTSMKFQRLSRITTGRAILSIFNLTEDQPTLDVPLPIQDGGNSLDPKEDSLSMRKVRSLKFKTKVSTLMLNQETSKLVTEVMTLDSNGKLCLLMITRSQRRVN